MLRERLDDDVRKGLDEVDNRLLFDQRSGTHFIIFLTVVVRRGRHIGDMEPNSSRQRPTCKDNLRPVSSALVVSLETRRSPVRNDETEHSTNADR